LRTCSGRNWSVKRRGSSTSEAFGVSISAITERALGLIPEHRRNQVCYFNVADRDHPVAMNILEDVAPDDRERLADNVVSAMRGIWADLGWGARMEQILRHSLGLELDVMPVVGVLNRQKRTLRAHQ
jgi:hypothetical protein